MSLILNARAPLLFVIADDTDVQALGAALRLAHSLDVYHKLDATIVTSDEVSRMSPAQLIDANIVAIGGFKNAFVKETLEHGKTSFKLRNGALHLHGRQVESDAAAIFLHPHPVSQSSLMAIMYHNDEAGLERLLRLFPIRTGVTVPDWVIVGPTADSTGTGGVLAAG